MVNGFRPHEARGCSASTARSDADSGYGVADEALEVIKALWSATSEDRREGAHFKVNGRIRRPVPATLPLLVERHLVRAWPRVCRAKHCDYLVCVAARRQDVTDLARDLPGRGGSARPVACARYPDSAT